MLDPSQTAAISFLFLLVLMLVSMGLWVRWRSVPPSVVFLVFGAFLLRVFFVVADHFMGIFAGGGHTDWTQFDAALVHVAEGWHKGNILVPLELANSTYTSGMKTVLFGLIYAPIYAIFGHHPVLVRLTIALTGTFVVFNIYRLGCETLNHRTGIYGGSIAAIFPFFIEQSGVILREMLVLLLLTEALYLLLRWLNTQRLITFIFALVVSVLAISVRLENIVPLGLAGGAAVFWYFDSNSIRVPAVLSIGFGTLGVVLVEFPNRVGVDGIASMRHSLTHGNAQYLSDVFYEGGFELLVFLPIGITYFLLVPFPWQSINTLATISILQNLLLWYPIVVLSVFGIRLVWQKEHIIAYVLLVYLIAGVVVYGSVAGNVGHAIRWRMQFQFVFFVLAGAVLAHRLRVRCNIAID